MRDRWMSPFTKWAIILCSLILFVGFLVGGAWMLLGSRIVSDGDRTGVITKFTIHRGWIWNTWEGEMLQGASKDASSSANLWAFSVADDAVVDKIHAAQRAAKPVMVHYQQQWSVQKWNGDTNYFVNEVYSQEK